MQQVVEIQPVCFLVIHSFVSQHSYEQQTQTPLISPVMGDAFIVLGILFTRSVSARYLSHSKIMHERNWPMVLPLKFVQSSIRRID